MESLRDLDLDDNKLSELPEDVCNLPILRLISLNGNMFTHIPDVFVKFDNLEVIDLADNPLEQGEKLEFDIKFFKNIGI